MRANVRVVDSRHIVKLLDFKWLTFFAIAQVRPLGTFAYNWKL